MSVYIDQQNEHVQLIKLLKQKKEENITELVNRCRKGDKFAQYSLYQNYADAMYATCYRLVQNKEEAEDIIQNTFIKVFSDIKKLKSPASFGAWLKQIVINKSLNSLRQKKMNFVELHENIPIETGNIELPEIDTETIKTAIKALPNGCRTIFRLHLIEDYKLTEIAKMLDISVSTSKSQYARAKQLLKNKLQKIYDARQV